VNVLTFFAHPDDETMLAGGILAILANQGAKVHYLCATRGEGGEPGNPPLCSQADLGAFREQELVCAVHALGGASLTFLGYTDPLVGPDDTLYPYAEDLSLLAGQVALSILEFAAEVAITHGSNGEYGHPAHVLTHQAARLAVESLGDAAPFLYTVQASFPAHPRPRLANKDDPADLIVDVTSGLPRKQAAAECHRTQHDLFTRKTAEEVGHPVSVAESIQRVTVESLHRAWPNTSVPLSDPLIDCLREARAIIGCSKDQK
jgi:N-acetylglucosamine malate deacetylase 2